MITKISNSTSYCPGNFFKVWYDSTSQLVRIDFRSAVPGPPYYTPFTVSRIHDFSRGNVYLACRECWNNRKQYIWNKCLSFKMKHHNYPNSKFLMDILEGTYICCCFFWKFWWMRNQHIMNAFDIERSNYLVLCIYFTSFKLQLQITINFLPDN